MSGDLYIPIIDFGKCGLQIEESEIRHSDLETVGEILYRAFRTSGFAYLTNHGISQDTVKKIFNIGKEFFDLPIDEKNRYVTGTLEYGGYEPIGVLKANPKRVYDEVEAFRFSRASQKKEDFLWPNVPGFRDEQIKFTRGLEKISMRVLRALAIGMKLKDPEYFCKHHDLTDSRNLTQFKLNHYPPLTHSPLKNQLRIGEHADKTSVTVMFTNGVPGLQMKNTEGNYVDIESIPGTVILYIGEILEAWSGNRLKAPYHRVVYPEDPEEKKKTRFSLPLFVVPDNDTRLEELEFQGCETPKVDETSMTCREYMDKIFKELLVGFNESDGSKQ